MPHKIRSHCIVALNDEETRFLLAGGKSSSANNAETFICDSPCSTWVSAGDLAGSARAVVTCGRVK